MPVDKPNKVHHTRYRPAQTTGYRMESMEPSADHRRIPPCKLDTDNIKMSTSVLRLQVQEYRQKLQLAEKQLTSSNNKLMRAEQRLHREQMNKTELESEKLDLMSEVTELRNQLKDVQVEKANYRDKFEHLQMQVFQLRDALAQKDKEIEELNNKLNSGVDLESRMADDEFATLKNVIKDLVAANEEKEMRIDELRKAVTTYQRVEEIILSSRSPRPKSEADENHITHLNSEGLSPAPSNQVNRLFKSSNGSLNQFSTISGITPQKKPLSVQRSNSYDASKFNRIIQPEWTVEPRTRKESSTSLPRDYNNRLDMSTITPKKDEEMDIFTDDEDVFKDTKKKKGLKKFLARLKRSTSQEVVMGSEGGFKRGGVRATAGPRLGGGAKLNRPENKSDNFLTPFSQWTSDQIITWLCDMGLNMYIAECRKWCRGGQHLLDASTNEIDKELKITNPLHKKKIHLAIDSIRSGNRKDQLILNLRPDWICKWLDDIGLPQYKDQFYEAKIDGRMLNYLTVEDLLYMKINNALHHASIRRGIEVLRKHNFNLATLRRRPSSKPEPSTLNGSKDKYNMDPTVWTNHRVMEWLRVIDLSEYAANLRGSGVHGALMVLEPRFSSEHLANILNIPTSKTLLRRHLNAHFVNLVGQEVQAKKREVEAQPGMLLTLNMKVKHKKQNLFKRGKSSSEYVCPMEIEQIGPIPKADDKKIKEAVALYKKELVKRDSTKRDSKDNQSPAPITDYEQFSEELKELTGLLSI